MGCAVELANVHHVVLVLQHGSLVVVDIQIIRGTENCHNTWETGRPSLSVHAVPGILGFVCSNDGEEIVLFQECASGRIGKEVGAAANAVVDEVFASIGIKRQVRHLDLPLSPLECAILDKSATNWPAQAIRAILHRKIRQ